MNDTRALVLEEKGRLSLRDCPVDETLGPHDVRIAVHTVGICGSDVHYCMHGAIGPFVVRAPMILGHEASGIVTEVGAGVTTLVVGDRVCMEPGIPNPIGRATRLGLYNLDPDVRAAAGVFAPLCPGGVVVLVGMPVAPIAYDVPAAQIKEARVEHVFRYAHVLEACVAMLGSGAIDLAPLITRSFAFADSVAAFELAAQGPAGQVKMQIVMDG